MKTFSAIFCLLVAICATQPSFAQSDELQAIPEYEMGTFDQVYEMADGAYVRFLAKGFRISSDQTHLGMDLHFSVLMDIPKGLCLNINTGLKVYNKYVNSTGMCMRYQGRPDHATGARSTLFVFSGIDRTKKEIQLMSYEQMVTGSTLNPEQIRKSVALDQYCEKMDSNVYTLKKEIPEIRTIKILKY